MKDLVNWSWIVRKVELLTMVHRVHHITFSYGWVFLPFMLGYFPEFRKVYGHTRGGTKLFCFVKPKEFHDCTWTRAY